MNPPTSITLLSFVLCSDRANEQWKAFCSQSIGHTAGLNFMLPWPDFSLHTSGLSFMVCYASYNYLRRYAATRCEFFGKRFAFSFCCVLSVLMFFFVSIIVSPDFLCANAEPGLLHNWSNPTSLVPGPKLRLNLLIWGKERNPQVPHFYC